jgi:hypothetical protein
MFSAPVGYHGLKHRAWRKEPKVRIQNEKSKSDYLFSADY